MTDVREAQIMQETIDSLKVIVAPTDNYNVETETCIILQSRKLIGDSINTSVEQVDGIPRSESGKSRAVISKTEPSSVD